MIALKYYVIVLNEGEQLEKRENGCCFTTSQTALGIKFAPLVSTTVAYPQARTSIIYVVQIQKNVNDLTTDSWTQM
jgi:hypothetical protein